MSDKASSSQERSGAFALPRPTTCRASLCGFAADGHPRVDVREDGHGPREARSVVPRSQLPVGCEVLLCFEADDPTRPVILGVIQPLEAEVVPTLPARGPSELGPATTPVEARVDGQRVVVEAEHELELRCGEASIVLRRNGRVVVRGNYVETRARGTHRIRGGNVQIN